MGNANKIKDPEVGGTGPIVRSEAELKFAKVRRDQRVELLSALKTMVTNIDTSDKESWKVIVSGLLDSGFTQSELEVELAASSNTIYKWRTGAVAPREMTRRLLRKEVLVMIDERMQDL